MHSPGLAVPALAGLTAWRLMVAACGFVGFGAAVAVMANPWPALSQQASLLTGVVYLGLALYPLFTRAHMPGSTWLRGATCVLLLLVAGTYLTLMSGDLGSVHSLFEHLLTPLVVLADWVLVGSLTRVRWWYPVSWLVFPLAYLSYFLVERPHLYRAFLDPDDSGFVGTITGFLVAVLAAGFVLYGIAKVRA